MRVVAATLLSLTIVYASPLGNGNAQPQLAPLSTTGDHIDDAYIVVLKKDIDINQVALHMSTVEKMNGLDPLFTYTSDGEVETGGINQVYSPTTNGGFGYYGYAGKFSNTTLTSILSAPEVDYVERDQMMYTAIIPQGGDDPVRIPEIPSGDLPLPPPKDLSEGIVTQLGAPWGLARISHRPQLHLSTFTKYVYHSLGGEGVTAYVIDTGINVEHVEFEGRARWGKTIPKGASDFDGNGHGSHCAGTIASRKYGVAKKAEVVAVKVLGDNGSGTMSDVIAGVVWAADQAAAANAAAKKELATTGKTTHKGSVASMSLGGGKAKTLDDAVNAAVDAGLIFAAAAGNDQNQDACNGSPSGAKNAITVGASTVSDEVAYFSSNGKCVDIFAPGLNILSTWTGGNQTSNTISGTSMATPHVAGLLAYLISIEGTETFSILSGDSQIVEESASLYAQAYSLLPSLAQAVLPVPGTERVNLAPVPKKGEITPAKLRKALIALASPGKLAKVPAGTVNLLAFNNATTEQ